MRICLAMAAAAVLLAGCGSFDGWLGGSDTAAFPPDRPVVASATPPVRSARCEAAARARAGDAAAQGFNDAVQRDVYQAALADCLKWEMRQ